MKRYVKSSYGDVILNKFILIPSDFIPGLEETKYDETLHGYFYLWSYRYNTLTKQTDDRLYSHADVIDHLPSDLRRKDRI